MGKIILPPFEPHAGQIRLIKNRRKRNVACMGRRWGKTYGLTEILINQRGGALAGADGTGRRGLPCAWYAPNDSYFQKVYQGIHRLYMPVIKKATSQPRPYIEFKNGGSIDFWTLEKPMRCGRGNHYARVILDEAAHAKYLQDAWEKTIEFTLADLDGDAWFISTPNGFNYFHELYRLAESDPDWISHNAPSTDNPYLPAGWFDKKRETMPELVYAQEVDAQFVSFGAGLVRSEYLIPGKPSPELRRVMGVDLAISTKESADYTAIITIVRDPSTGLVYIVDAERFRGEFNEVLNRIKLAAARHAPKLIAVEKVQYQAAVVQELARTTTLPVRGVEAERDKLSRFLPALLAFERRSIRYDPETVPRWFLDELLAFPGVEGIHDDGVDGLAHAFNGLSFAQPTPDYSRSGLYRGNYAP